jgi:manganese transport protein
VIVLSIYGDRGSGPLIVFSQVILSLQLPFAVFPLVMFTGDHAKMGPFVAPLWMRALAWPMAILILSLNAWLLWQTFTGGV